MPDPLGAGPQLPGELFAVLRPLLGDNLGGEVEVAGEPGEGKVPGGENSSQPFDLRPQVQIAAYRPGCPAQNVLVVVPAPRHPRVAIALLLVGELLPVPLADLCREGLEIEDLPADQLRLAGRWMATGWVRAAGQSATTS